MFDSILVVCVGNICRSPTGERLLRKLLPDKKINSAGLGALIGKPADDFASKTALSHGLSLDGHSAQQLTVQLCRDHELILVMERRHIEAVCKLLPESRGKVMLYGHWHGNNEIPDPYRKNIEAFEFVFNELNASAIKWAQKLS